MTRLRKRTSLLLLFLSVLVVNSSQAQFWEITHASLGEVEDLLLLQNGDVLALVGSAGIFISQDNGSSFIKVSGASFMRELAYGNGRVYASGLSGTFVSDDNGMTWSPLLLADGWSVTAIDDDV